MVAVAACGQVRAGQAALAQLRTVGAAADRRGFELRAERACGVHRLLHDLKMRPDLLQHVAVLLAQRQNHRARAVFLVQKRRGMPHQLFSGFKRLRAVVADDIAEVRRLHAALHVGQVEKALVALRMAGRVARRQHGVEFHRDERGVDHRVLRRTGVNVEAVDRDVRGGGVEVLILDLARRAAVHRVGQRRAEALQIQQRRAVADLLVRAKADRHRPVHLRAGEQRLRRRHDLRDPGLVVRAQHGRPVRDDQGLSDVALQIRKLLRAQRPSALSQRDGAPVVMLDHAWLHVLPGKIRHRVDVGEKAHAGACFQSRRRGDLRIYIGMRVLVHIRRAHGGQFFRQKSCQIVLAGGRGGSLPALAAGRVDARIAQKPFISSHVPPPYGISHNGILAPPLRRVKSQPRAGRKHLQSAVRFDTIMTNANSIFVVLQRQGTR